MSVAIESVLKCKVIVIKVASRCNLNCKYCYMYNMGDTTYRDQPKVMPDNIVDALIDRVYEHCMKHEIPKFTFVFHGGEPMLAGKQFFTKIVIKAQAKFDGTPTKVNFGIQTNGVLLTDEWCEILGELGISIGISLDGTREVNDEFRIYHNGKGTYDDIVKGYQIAKNSPATGVPGLLSVINIDADPEEAYHHFKSLNASSFDFLLPDSNFDCPPPQPKNSTSDTPYADWLIKIFNLWVNDPQRPDIRYFKAIIYGIMGIELASDNLGTGNAEVLVIETNGDMEAVDSLKICGDGFTKGNANVLTMSFDEALETPLAKLYQMSHQILSSDCMACPVSEICGSGILPHRYSSEKGFDNPSVYCKDLLKIISHIQNVTLASMPPELLEEVDVHPVIYEEALQEIRTNSKNYQDRTSKKLLDYART